MPTRPEAPQPDDLSKYMKAVLMVLLDSRDENQSQTKPEILLRRAGLSIKGIADILGKNEEAIRKAISRAK